MSPPLNKYKNNPEKQTRAAINILPYIRNNALYLLLVVYIYNAHFHSFTPIKTGKEMQVRKGVFRQSVKLIPRYN